MRRKMLAIPSDLADYRGGLARHCYGCPLGPTPLDELKSPTLERRRAPDCDREHVRRLVRLDFPPESSNLMDGMY